MVGGKNALNRLNGSQLDAARARESAYPLADGGGLVLLVQPNGSRWWRFRYRYNGVARMLSMGTYPDTGLAVAREKRREARALLAKGVDPSAHRKVEKSTSADSFEALAEEYMARSSAQEATLATMRRRLQVHIYPRIGKRPISEINSQELLMALRRVEARQTYETAHRIRTYCGQVFRYAIATGRASVDPSQALSGALKPVKTKHMAHVTGPKAMGELMRAIEGYSGHAVSVAALKLAPLVFARPGELRGAEWSEFNLDSGGSEEWRIPAHRMKTGKPHVVPLSCQAVAILKDLHPLTGNGTLVFPSLRTRNRPLSENTLTAALRRLGYPGDQMTCHGFRGMASTSLHEQGYPSEHIERQLAHVDKNKIRATYNHAGYLPQRRQMMQAWADYLYALRDGSNVVPIHEVAVS